MTEVKLTKPELMVAGLVGNMRMVASENLTDQRYSNDSSWTIHIEGAMCEMAFAKWMNVYYVPSVNTFKNPDVGKIQIRSTKLPHGKLIVRKRDLRDEIYVLVINEAPIFRMVGWIKCEEAKQEKYEFDPRNGHPSAWMVPQSDLNKMEDLDVKTLSTDLTRSDRLVDPKDG